jgi:hypothetical protein
MPSQFAVHQPVKAIDLAASGESYQFHFARISRLKPDGRSGRNAQPKPSRLLAVKVERAIRLEKMEVAADLNGAVAAIGNNNLPHFEANIGFMGLTVSRQSDLSRDHRIGW